ncbi:autotransporter, partial [Bartonella henselae]
MRHKYKLSFSIFIISSCFVQVANAGENRNGELKRLENLGNGRTVPTGSALVTNTVPISSNITVSEGGVEIVDNRGTSMGATIQKGGMQIVTRGATAMGTKILGGKQFVYEEKSLRNLDSLDSINKRSSAYEAVVSGGDRVVGQQNVYDGAMVWNTKVLDGGEQNLYMGPRKEGGIAKDTIVSGNGKQHILAGGRASNTTLNDNATQVVYSGGILDGLTINGHASSWIHVGTKDVVGKIRVNNDGELYLFAGDSTNRITKKRISIEGRSDETLFVVGERSIAERPEINIENLEGEGGTVIFTSIPYDPHHISLHVKRLSGSLRFQFNISARGNGSDYLSIDNGTGKHKISVADSGVEITTPLLQRNGLVTEINLITDRSGGTDFTLEDSFGTEITSVDGGTYIYTLQKRDRSADFNGDSTIWYLGLGTEGPKSSSFFPLRTSKRPKVTIFSGSSSSEAGTRSQQSSSASRERDPNFRTTTGGRNSNKIPKQRPPRHLREVQHSSVLSATPFLENPASDMLRPTGSYHNSDGKEPSVVSADGQSLVDQMIVRSGQQGSSSPQSSQKLSVSNFLTTPSTDAVLSMSVTPALVFHNELQAVRAGRGILDRGKKNTAFWAHAIKSKEHIVADHKDFKLDQTGIVLGVSGVSELMGGEFYIGGFGSYDQARVAHARGGVSGISTYSIGAYATYFDKSGWYLDS